MNVDDIATDDDGSVEAPPFSPLPFTTEMDFMDENPAILKLACK